MSFRPTFDCLWCGASHTVRGAEDLEGWAQLCPTCLGRAGENGFLRMRLRSALTERAAADTAMSAPDPALDAETRAYHAARAYEDDDWYLRRGRYSRGPVHDVAWQAELDTATMWLDGLPLGGEIVELAAGTGWWSPLLAARGELRVYDSTESSLERARERLLAHRLRAHLHVRDPWAEPDRQVDVLFTALWLSRVPRQRLGTFLELARRWLRPGGLYAFIDALSEADAQVPRRADESDPPISGVSRPPSELRNALLAAGFAEADVTTTSRFFVLGSARTS